MKTLSLSKLSKKALSLFVALVMIAGMAVVAPTASADSVSIDSASVFLKQNSSNTCTLASAAMMMRRKSILLNDTDWNTITEASIKSRAWNGTSGLWSKFITCGMTVSKTWGSYNSVSALKNLIDTHPEGVVIHIDNSKMQHGVLLVKYDSSGNFYCADPAGSAPSGIIKLTESHYADVYKTQDAIIAALEGYVWLISAYESGNPDSHTVPSSTLSSGSTGDSVRWVQSVLYKVGLLSRMKIDGDYGSGTTSAVKSYQTKHNLTVTGKCDTNTISQMKSSWQSIKGSGSDNSSDTNNSSYKTGTYRVQTVDANSSLNMRASASSSASILTKVPNQTLVVITEISNNFGKTTYNGYTGWLSMSYLTFVSSSTTITTDTSTSSQSTAKTGTYQVTTNGGNLNMRASASSSAKVLTTVPNGTKVVVTEISNGFGKATYKGYTGWMSMSYLKFVSSSTTVTTDTSSSTQTQGIYQVTTIDGGYLYMRASANSNGSVISLVPNGTRVVVTEFSNGYGKTTYDGNTGWLSLSYLKFISSSTTVTTDSSTSQSTNKTGTYQVTTNGGNLNMRASASTGAAVLTTVPNGTKVVVTEFSNGFGKATYNGKTGWLSLSYLTLISTSTTVTTDTDTSGSTYKTGTYQVTTNGGNLNMRASASTGATVLTTVPNGTKVVVTEFSNGFGKATYNGKTGWMSLSYLKFVSSSTTVTTDTSSSTQTTGTYQVMTNGANLILRSSPSSSGTLIALVPDGTKVVITEISNGYGKTTYNGTTGWLSMSYLKSASSSSGTTDTTVSSLGNYQVTTNGGNLNMRSAPSTSATVIQTVANGTVLTITEISNGFGKATYNGKTGWLSMSYLKPTSSASVTTDTSSKQLGTYQVTTKDVNGRLNMRVSPSPSASVIQTVPNKTNVVVTDISGNFAKATYNGLTGWMSLDYLTFVSSSADADTSSSMSIGSYKVVTSGSGLNLRSAASTSSSVILAVPNGTALSITEISNGYGKTTYNGKTGWVSMQYLVKTTDSSGGSTPTQQYGMYQVTTNGGSLILRSMASSSGSQLALVPNGTKVVVTEISNGYGKTLYDGKTGWLSMNYLTFVSSNTSVSTDSSSTAGKTGIYKVTTNSGGLNLRSAPSTAGTIILSVPKGTNVTVTEITNGYGKVTYGGATGWLSMAYLTFVSESSTDTTQGTVTGTYKVVTNGGSLVLREAPSTSGVKVALVPNGTVVTITDVSNGYGKTTYNGNSGWLSMSYLSKTEVSTGETTGTGTKLEGTYIVNTTSSNLNMRSGPSTSDKVITTIPKGTMVSVTQVSNGWGKVSYNGYTGWVSMDYLAATGSGTSLDSDDNETSTAEPGTYIVNTSSGSLRLRQDPDLNASTLAAVPKGTQLVITEIKNGWGKATYSGKTGWVSMAYMLKISDSTTPSGSSSSETAAYVSGTYKVTTEGGNLILRSEPISGKQVALIPNGTVLEVTEFDGDWGKTTFNGVTGWISMNWLSEYAASSSEEVSGEETGYAIGAYNVTISSGTLRMRQAPTTNSETVGVLQKGTRVVVTEITNGFGKVTHDGVTGWVSMAYLTKADDEISEDISSNYGGEIDEEVSNGEISNGEVSGGEISGEVTVEAGGEVSVVYKVESEDGSGVPIYQNRDTSSQVLGEIPDGAEVISTNTVDDWAYVTYGGITGWVQADYLLINDNEALDSNTAYVIKTLDIVGSVTMHAEPKGTSKKVGKIPNGTIVLVEEQVKKWSKVTYNGVTGWIRSMYLESGDKSIMDDINNGINQLIDTAKDTDYEQLLNTVINLFNKNESNSDEEIMGDEVTNGNEDEVIGGDGEIVGDDVNRGELGDDYTGGGSSEEADPSRIRYGDINCDGRITLEDVVLYQKIKAQLQDFTAQGRLNADVDGNGLYDMSDIVDIQRYIAKLITSFKAELSLG